MNRKLFILIPALMTVCLTGVVLLQIFWLRNVLKLESIEFDRNVNVALQHTAGKLEEKNDYRFVKEHIEPEIKFIANTHSELRDSHLLPPSSHLDKNKKEISIYTIHDSSGVHFTQKVNEVTITSQSQTSQNSPGRVKKDRIERIVTRLVVEMDSTFIPVIEKINPELLKDELTNNLAKQGIQIPFEYSIENLAGMNLFKTIGFKKSPNSYSTLLFPGNLPGGSGMMQLYFPDRNEFITGNIWLNGLTSIAFTLILISAFGFTLYTLFKQKKISDIKNDFISNLTHEFKTPIATISVALDTLKESVIMGNTAMTRKLHGIIREENERMNEQVSKVLQLALTEKENFMPDKEELNLSSLLKKVISKYELLASEKEIRILFSGREDTRITGDKFHLENALGNLLDNAIKYSGRGTVVETGITCTNGILTLFISDQGIGMNEDIKSHIFEKFYRGQKGNLHEVKGFGIGLSYVQNVIHAHGGKIKVSSPAGKGSTFYLEFNITEC